MTILLPCMVFTNVYNLRSAVPRRDEHGQSRVMRGASLGADCTIVCDVTIGRHALVAAGRW